MTIRQDRINFYKKSKKMFIKNGKIIYKKLIIEIVTNWWGDMDSIMSISKGIQIRIKWT